MERHGLAGVGLVLTSDDDMTGGDLDHCITDAGSFSEVAAEIISYGETYAEISPSGEGIRVFARGKLGAPIKNDSIGIEVYCAGRYLTITGRQIEGTPCEIREAPRTLARLSAIVDAARGTTRPQPNGKAPSGADDFFGNVNAVALARLDDWVPVLHPTARKYATGAWRVTSKDLGRNLQEDLAYHPEGIRDHGEECGFTPIDTVLRYGDCTDARAAAMWLCHTLSIEPASLGWQGNANRAASPLEDRQFANGNDLANGAARGDGPPVREQNRAKRAGTSSTVNGNDRRSGDETKTEGAKRTQAQVLIEIATGPGVNLFHSRDRTAYADIIVDGHRET
jgi:hypothetical protein